MHVFYKCPQREPRELHCSLGGVFFFSLLRKDEEKSRKEIRTKEKRILLPIFISIIQTWENEAPTVPGASSTRNYFENTMKQLPLPKAKLCRESPGRHGRRADMAVGQTWPLGFCMMIGQKQHHFFPEKKMVQRIFCFTSMWSLCATSGDRRQPVVFPLP